MKKALFALVLLIASPALAQQPVTFTLSVTAAELELISAALGKQVYMDVRDLVNKLQAQVNQQVQERANVGKK